MRKRLVIYVSPITRDALRRGAKERRQSVSRVVNDLIEWACDPENAAPDPVVTRLDKLTAMVDHLARWSLTEADYFAWVAGVRRETEPLRAYANGNGDTP